MSYPDPVLPPKTNGREERFKNLLRSSGRGILVRSVIVGIELLGVLYFESSSLFVDAIASVFDIVSSLVLLYFIKYATKPPDENHPFGHGRLEPLVGLQMGLLLALTGLGIGIREISFSYDVASHSPISPFAWLVPAGATLFLELTYQNIKRTAEKEDSQAMLADARHYRIDSITSFIASLSLLVALFSPSLSALADHMGALLISIVMIILGYFAAKDNIAEIMDRTPKAEYFEKVKRAAFKVAGVLGTEKIRIQHYGPDSHVDIDVEVDPNLSVFDAHTISQKVRAEIQKDWPKVQDVTVHIEPFFPNDHK